MEPTFLSAETCGWLPPYYQRYDSDPYAVVEILNRSTNPSLIPEELLPRRRGPPPSHGALALAQLSDLYSWTCISTSCKGRRRTCGCISGRPHAVEGVAETTLLLAQCLRPINRLRGEVEQGDVRE
ncbi:hypothetical protein EYF80_021220 [Liparis tanakae]|uniref:Uncharacterized protein n=1 Tax=Liparis tanakae TaxID=230148 RepID=A0A4Z2HU94_9TELE|nr:hypothetical protein EYF80_021220 [Liparis tanakae]